MALATAIEIEKKKGGLVWNSAYAKDLSECLRLYMRAVEKVHRDVLLKTYGAGVDWDIMNATSRAVEKPLCWTRYLGARPTAPIEELHADLRSFLDRLDAVVEGDTGSSEELDYLVDFLLSFHAGHLSSAGAVWERRRFAT